MYKLWAKAIKNNKTIQSIDVQNNEAIPISSQKKKCFDEIFYKLDISTPVWLPKHELELAEFKMIVFYKEDFMDEVFFDKLEIVLIDDGASKKNNKNL